MAIVINGSGTISGITAQASDVELTDNTKLKLGTGDDLEIYHDGTDSYIHDSGTGNLQLRTNGSEIGVMGNDGSEYMGKFIQDGAVTLYHNNAAKIATSATGVAVTGAIAGATNLGKVLQVVSFVTNTTSSINSTSFQNTGLEMTITPSSSSSKVFVMANMGVGTDDADMSWAIAGLYRSSTELQVSIVARDMASGARGGSLGMSYLDSPNTTSATTYYIKGKVQNSSSTFRPNYVGSGASIVLMEIGA